VDHSVLVFYCCMTMLGHILPVCQLKQSGKFILSVTLICYICLAAPPMTTMCLGCSRKKFLMQWESARDSAWVATHVAKGFFTRNLCISEGLKDMYWMQWRLLKNDKGVPNLFALNYLTKKCEGFRLTHPRVCTVFITALNTVVI
jgi:hypothetical protein